MDDRNYIILLPIYTYFITVHLTENSQVENPTRNRQPEGRENPKARSGNPTRFLKMVIFGNFCKVSFYKVRGFGPRTLIRIFFGAFGPDPEGITLPQM